MFVHDKRRYFRIHFKRQVRLDFLSDSYEQCEVQNISLGGMFVKGNFPYKVDDECYITIFYKSSTTHLTFKAQANIVRHKDDGIALQFTSMSFESLVLLELILLYEPREESADSVVRLPKDLPFKVCEEDTPVPDNDLFF